MQQNPKVIKFPCYPENKKHTLKYIHSGCWGWLGKEQSRVNYGQALIVLNPGYQPAYNKTFC